MEPADPLPDPPPRRGTGRYIWAIGLAGVAVILLLLLVLVS
jgi:hypothetical protein